MHGLPVVMGPLPEEKGRQPGGDHASWATDPRSRRAPPLWPRANVMLAGCQEAARVDAQIQSSLRSPVTPTTIFSADTDGPYLSWVNKPSNGLPLIEELI